MPSGTSDDIICLPGRSRPVRGGQPDCKRKYKPVREYSDILPSQQSKRPRAEATPLSCAKETVSMKPILSRDRYEQAHWQKMLQVDANSQMRPRSVGSMTQDYTDIDTDTPSWPSSPFNRSQAFEQYQSQQSYRQPDDGSGIGSFTLTPAQSIQFAAFAPSETSTRRGDHTRTNSRLIASSPAFNFSSSPAHTSPRKYANDTISISSSSASVRAVNTRQEQKLKNLQKILDQIGSCSICWFADQNPGAKHTAFGCIEREKYLGNGFFQFKKAMKFTKVKICYFCVVPAAIQTSHPEGPQGGCRYDDIVKPLAFMIFDQPLVRRAVFSLMDLPESHFLNINEYARWLAQQGHAPGSLVNALEVILLLGQLKRVV
jgi:hypothetical protein